MADRLAGRRGETLRFDVDLRQPPRLDLRADRHETRNGEAALMDQIAHVARERAVGIGPSDARALHAGRLRHPRTMANPRPNGPDAAKTVEIVISARAGR